MQLAVGTDEFARKDFTQLVIGLACDMPSKIQLDVAQIEIINFYLSS
jgi:hypothetical protein